MDYSRFLNTYGNSLRKAIIRQMIRNAGKGVDISATVGFPNPIVFPVTDATFKLQDGTEIQLTKEDMKVALQYSSTRGHDKLVDTLYKMQCDEHHPPTASHETEESKMAMMMSPGSQMAISTFTSICVQDKVPIIFSTPSFALISMQICDLSDVLCVDIDADGTDPSSLRQVMSRWTPADANNPKSGIPRILWLNPCCNNPTGVTTSRERREEIYAIAREYNLLIVEDDPYYYLQENMPRIPSYLSLDADGRVLRFDSFSKTISPGLRVAFITGPQAIVQKMECALMQNAQMTSGLSQMLVYKLLKLWGATGFEDHVQRSVKLNREKRLYALGLADKWLKGLAEWNVPPGGMFVFFKVYGIGLTSEELNERLMEEEKVAVVPASAFYPKHARLKDVAIFRIAVAMASSEVIEKVFMGLSKVIQEAQKG